MEWKDLQTGAFGASASIPGVDASLVWADASEFVDFRRPLEPRPELIPVIVELRKSAKQRRSALSRLHHELAELNGGSVPAVYPRIDEAAPLLYCTALFTAAYCKAVLAGMGDPKRTIGSMINRFELQMSVVPLRPQPLRPGNRAAKQRSPRPRAGKTLVGVIDTGCPFAHQLLRDVRGTGTRLLGIWDQDAAPAFASEADGGGMPADLGYGCEIDREQMNAVMAKCSRNGVISEDACYEMVGYTDLRHRLTHGAAVLDLLAGPCSFEARSSVDPDVIPTWQVDLDKPIHHADIAFVQLPRDAVQDSSSAGLTRLLLDGLRYILSFAGDKTERIVVNISDGSSRGTHDGASIFERAMVALVEEQRAKGRELHIVLAAGNGLNEARHGQLDPKGPKGPLTLRLQPGCEAPSYLVARIPASAKKLRITVKPPGAKGARIKVERGQAVGWCLGDVASCAVIVPLAVPGQATCALIAWAPTASSRSRPVAAESGDWKIDAESAPGRSEPVHFYVARNQTNPGGLKRALQARFLDRDGQYDPTRPRRLSELDPAPPSSPIRRRGTLSGLGSGPKGTGVTVVGATRHREQTVSIYSSDGPAAGIGPVRVGPDAFAPADESRALAGIRSSGSRSGESVRVTGTSFAVPQVARKLVNGK